MYLKGNLKFLLDYFLGLEMLSKFILIGKVSNTNEKVFLGDVIEVNLNFSENSREYCSY